MTQPTCETCRFFYINPEHPESGKCRRNPPVIVVMKDNIYWGEFPYIPIHFGCGEHQPPTTGGMNDAPQT